MLAIPVYGGCAWGHLRVRRFQRTGFDLPAYSRHPIQKVTIQRKKSLTRFFARKVNLLFHLSMRSNAQFKGALLALSPCLHRQPGAVAVAG